MLTDQRDLFSDHTRPAVENILSTTEFDSTVPNCDTQSSSGETGDSCASASASKSEGEASETDKSCDCRDACECSVEERDASDEETSESDGTDEERDASDEETSESDSTDDERDTSDEESDAETGKWMNATYGDRVAVRDGKLDFSQLLTLRKIKRRKGAGDVEFIVLDPGLVSWMSILRARLCRRGKEIEIELLGWTTVPAKVYHKAMSSYVELQKYDKERRTKKEEYQRAIDICKGTRKNTCHLAHYEEYFRASLIAATSFMHEQGQVHRNKLKFRLRVESRKNMDTLVKEICGSRKNKIDAVFFGQGNVNGARGSPCVGSKKAMRAFARRVFMLTTRDVSTARNAQCAFRMI
eukprot:g3444.t1